MVAVNFSIFYMNCEDQVKAVFQLTSDPPAACQFLLAAATAITSVLYFFTTF